MEQQSQTYGEHRHGRPGIIAGDTPRGQGDANLKEAVSGSKAGSGGRRGGNHRHAAGDHPDQHSSGKRRGQAFVAPDGRPAGNERKVCQTEPVGEVLFILPAADSSQASSTRTVCRRSVLAARPLLTSH